MLLVQLAAFSAFDEMRVQLLPLGFVQLLVQIGREQWVLYRSLTGPANRTLLGINTYSEFLLGRFERTGECKPILEIEPAAD